MATRNTKRGLGTATAAVTAPTIAEPAEMSRQARIWRETRRDLMARKCGYLMARDYLDAALDDAGAARYGSDRDEAQVVAALLAVCHHLDAEMAAVDAQMQLVDVRMRGGKATPAA